MANILIACEFSGAVREAFRALGHNAISADLLPADDASPHHHTGDVFELLEHYRAANGKRYFKCGIQWHALIAFPPCTHLASSGARWWAEKRADGRQANAVQFVRRLASVSPIKYKAIENPIGYLSTAWRKPDQIIQPWQFGHGETKATCLWLQGLPELVPTDIVDGREPRIHRMPPTPDRAKLRSVTYPGIAAAMADQWAPILD